MHLQRCLSLPKRSPNPLLPQRMCLVLLQLLPTHMCKFFYLCNLTDLVEFAKHNVYPFFYFYFYIDLELYRESAQACALCNCVERSLHGQRELRHFRPSSEWQSLKPSASPPPQPGNDDLSSIGFSDTPCLATLFDDSG